VASRLHGPEALQAGSDDRWRLRYCTSDGSSAMSDRSIAAFESGSSYVRCSAPPKYIGTAYLIKDVESFMSNSPWRSGGLNAIDVVE
jgi:hypothetical protein